MPDFTGVSHVAITVTDVPRAIAWYSDVLGLQMLMPTQRPGIEGALLLHIGPYKTGTTAIQQALHDARPSLRERGIIYPGKSRRQRRSGWSVMDRHPLGRRNPVIR